MVLAESLVPMFTPIVSTLLTGFLMLSLAEPWRGGNVAGERGGRAPADVAAAARDADADGPHRHGQGLAPRDEAGGCAGLGVNAYAVGLDHPRWLYVLPNGDVLVAESNGPPRPDDGGGIKAG